MPKHRVVAWLVAKQRLRTKDKLLPLGVVTDDLCPLCGAYPESHEHLFFTCPYSRRCISTLSSWVGIVFRPMDKMDFRKSKKNCMQRRLICAIYVAVIYHIWMNRNAAIWKGYVCTQQQVFNTIRLTIRSRMKGLYPMDVNNHNIQWLYVDQ